jgi:hypothetical protein
MSEDRSSYRAGWPPVIPPREPPPPDPELAAARAAERAADAAHQAAVGAVVAAGDRWEREGRQQGRGSPLYDAVEAARARLQIADGDLTAARIAVARLQQARARAALAAAEARIAVQDAARAAARRAAGLPPSDEHVERFTISHEADTTMRRGNSR